MGILTSQYSAEEAPRRQVFLVGSFQAEVTLEISFAQGSIEAFTAEPFI